MRVVLFLTGYEEMKLGRDKGQGKQKKKGE